MMRVLLVAMLALCAVAEERPNDLQKRFMDLPHDQQANRIKALLNRGFMDDKLMEFLVGMKETIKNGSEDWGIPPLDPINQDHFEGSLDHEQADMDIVLDGLYVTGLSGYAVNLATFDMLKMKIGFNLSFPELHAMAEHYWMEGTVAEMVPIFGEGSLDIRVIDLSISGNIEMGISGNAVSLKNVELDVILGGLQMNLTGLLGGGELGEMLNEVISTSAPELWEELKPAILPEVSNMVIEFANEQLAGITLEEIIDIILGNNKLLR